VSKIVVLDELTASQIAAGEVIERPASVVKETVENSLDAGATQVTVEIRAGGIKYIRITDNGSGFESDDAVIAFEKHATSKIRSGADLENVSTLGFRGEALASIAAVADVELLSRTEDAANGIYVHIKGGEVLECSDRGSAKGTVLTVRDLFYNVPARYKFLKKDQTEAGYVADILEKMALAHPEVSFRLISNGQELLRTPGGELKTAVYSIFGKEVMNDLLNISYSDGENTVTGFAGVRGAVYGTRARQMFFVNGRLIKSKLISSAVDEAYKTVTMKHQFPLCILNITVPGTKVDVNVHPAKTEVRFSAERAIFSVVYNALHSGLLEDNREHTSGSFTGPDGYMSVGRFQTPPDDYSADNSTGFAPKSVDKPVENSRKLWKFDTFQPVSDKKSDEFEKKVSENAPAQKPEYVKPADSVTETENVFVQTEKPAVTVPDETPSVKPQTENEPNPEAPSFTETVLRMVDEASQGSEVRDRAPGDAGTYNSVDVYTRARIIGVYLKTYILLELDGELVIIDQHAAHERVKYEAISAAIDRADAMPPVSPLLLPVKVKLTPAEYVKFNEFRKYFDDIGFEIDDFGANTVIVRAVPSVLSEADPEELIVTGLQAAMSAKGRADNVFRTEAVYTMACKAAVKGGQELSEAEIKGLLSQLTKLENSATCPHGRPIVIRITQDEMEKRFHRCL